MKYANEQQVHMMLCAFSVPRTLVEASMHCHVPLDLAKTALRALIYRGLVTETADRQGRLAYVRVDHD